MVKSKNVVWHVAERLRGAKRPPHAAVTPSGKLANRYAVMSIVVMHDMVQVLKFSSSVDSWESLRGLVVEGTPRSVSARNIYLSLRP